MKRSNLKRCAREIAAELRQEAYEHWITADFPVLFERVWEGQPVEVEVEKLEANPEYVHLGIAISDGKWLTQYWPVSTSVLIARRLTDRSAGDHASTG